MATAILPLSLYRDIKITAATIDHKLSPPIARHKSNIENIDGPNLGRGVGDGLSKIGAGLSGREPAPILYERQSLTI